MNNDADNIKVLISNKTVQKNILAIKQHSDITRQQVKELRELVEGCRSTVDTMRAEIVALRTQVQQLQIKLYSGGATHGDHDSLG